MAQQQQQQQQQHPPQQPMFSCVVPGRPMLAFQQVNPKKFVATIPGAMEVREVMFVALRPQAIPQGHGLTIYYSLSNNNREWEYLGSLLPQRPSLLVRTPWLDLQNPNVAVQFGLSLETQEFIRNVDEGRKDESAVVRDVGLAIGKHLYTWMSSFAQRTGQFKDLGEVLLIPTSCIDKWWTKFREKQQRTPYFFMHK